MIHANDEVFVSVHTFRDYIAVAQMRAQLALERRDSRRRCALQQECDDRLELARRSVNRARQSRQWAGVDSAAWAGDVVATRRLGKRVVDLLRRTS